MCLLMIVMCFYSNSTLHDLSSQLDFFMLVFAFSALIIKHQIKEFIHSMHARLIYYLL